MSPDKTSRRRFLRSAAGAGAMIAVAGCVALEPPRASNQPAEARTWFRAVYEESIPAVVEIVAESEFTDSSGSGFHVDRTTVVTNAHVVFGSERVTIRDWTHEWGGADVVGTDVYSDLAVLERDEPLTDGHELAWTGTLPPIGTEVMAVGAPLGFSGSASTGIVSGVNRALPGPTGFSIAASIQTEAAINPGNSGGPLLDGDGRVVGVVFAQHGDNIGFAISSPVGQQVVPVLARGETFEHSFVGIAHRDVTPRIAAAHDLSPARGVYVDQVLTDSPADGVLHGSESTQERNGRDVNIGGDIVLAIDGTEMPTGDALGAYLLLETRPGQTATFDVFRDGEQQSIDVTLGRRPEPDEPFP